MRARWLLLLVPSLSVAASPEGPETSKPQPPPATVGTGKAAAPQAPAKGIEEPLFQMPELVIIGENQARIMAQKEQLTASPTRGLHEAPLLEKEESSVNGLRRRLPPPYPGFTRSGTFGAVRLEGGSPLELGGGAVFGRQSRNRLGAIDVSGSTVRGEPVGTGHAGGRDVAVTAIAERAGDLPATFPRLPFVSAPDLSHLSARWRASSRDLLGLVTTGSVRRSDELSFGADLSSATTGLASGALLQWTSITAPPTGRQHAWTLAGRTRFLHWSRGALGISSGGQAHAESADALGDHLSAGGDLTASWIPGERWRAEAGVALEGVFGGGLFAGAVRPRGGLAFASPAGAGGALTVGGGLDTPWMSREASANPYAVFAARLVPRRDLLDGELSGWFQRREGCEVRAGWRVTESRNAGTWVERPGEGLFQPAALAALRVQTFSVNGRQRGPAGWDVSAGARWRLIKATGGEMANLARGEVRGSVTWTRDAWTLGGTVEHVRGRARSAAGGAALDPFTDLGASADWRALSWATLSLKASNLLGQTIEHWGGYPEPRHLVTLSALAVF